MTRRANRLIMLALAVISVTIYFGCTQPEDVVQPVARSVLTLDARLVPSLPDSMAYEIWLATSEETVSVARFNYDQSTKSFLNEDGTVREDGNEFEFDGDILSFSEMWVAVQRMDDPPGHSSGPIMLWDVVTDPITNPIDLKFPLSDSLWFATARYNMVTTSDSDHTTNRGAGLWLATYTLTLDSIQDTLGLDSVVVDSEEVSQPDEGEVSLTTIQNFTQVGVDTIERVFGFDTLTQVRVLLDTTLRIDSTAPYMKYTAIRYYTLGTLNRLFYDRLTQDQFGFPPYTDWGWNYRGWVVTPAIEAQGASVGSLTHPAWDIVRLNSMPGYDGGMLSTGAFDTVTQGDFENPYAAGPRIPSVPGEDFLENLPNGVSTPVNLLPNPSGNEGSFFITLEPNNYTDRTTNFPLIAFIGVLPSSQSQLALTPIGTGSGGLPPDSLQQFTMKGFMQTNDPARGFPKIRVGIQRF